MYSLRDKFVNKQGNYYIVYISAKESMLSS
jgi:hypothetical protein